MACIIRCLATLMTSFLVPPYLNFLFSQCNCGRRILLLLGDQAPIKLFLKLLFCTFSYVLCSNPIKKIWKNVDGSKCLLSCHLSSDDIFIIFLLISNMLPSLSWVFYGIAMPSEPSCHSGFEPETAAYGAPITDLPHLTVGNVGIRLDWF